MGPRHGEKWTALLLTTLALTACGGREDVPDPGPQDPLWETVLDRHTRGEISRRERIRVVFNHDVVPERRVGGDAGDFLSVSPQIGTAAFTSRREIVVTPEGDLEPGRAYLVTLRAEGLDGLPPELDRYQFTTRVMQQGFDVGVAGLSPDPDADSTFLLAGTLVTADFDDPDAVERIVGASVAGRRLEVRWSHEADGRRHAFTVPGIVRGASDAELTLTWNGAPIGVDAEGDRRVVIPAAGVFTVTRIDAVQDQRQYVVVQFSDFLDPLQNLGGLVALGGQEFTVGLDRNQIRLYPSAPVTGDLTVTVQPGVVSRDGRRLDGARTSTVTFAQTEPGVRFVGAGTILPDADVLSVPIEAVNVHSVQVTAFRVEERNVGQFLQVNDVDGTNQLGRVGRYLWRKTIPLASPLADQWNRYSLDLTELMSEYRSGLVRLTLSINRSNATYTCTEEANAVPVVEEAPLVDVVDYEGRANSSWTYVESYAIEGGNLDFRDRDDPCTDAYYRWSGRTKAGRNFMASNLGILAKRDPLGSTLVATTNLRTSEPEAGVRVRFMSFQDLPITEVTTDGEGMARLDLDETPFYAVAEKGDDRGYLRMSSGSALATSHFDVGGAVVRDGLKGIVYAERGVWRPGDTLHLTFVAQDERGALPDGHPATLELFNPRGQRLQSITNTTPTHGFYAFRFATDRDAPTGTWSAAVEIGGSRYTKALKIETVVPNRLKVELEMADGDGVVGRGPFRATLLGQWLSGALARDLQADVEVRLQAATTRFEGFEGFAFDDPARTVSNEPRMIFEGVLDAQGRAPFEADLTPSSAPPGFVAARFRTRVFERGGAFSTGYGSATYAPFDRYVGVRLPPGDRRGRLLTDTTHTVEIATVDGDGSPAATSGLKVTVHKIDWRWWWDRSGENLGQYASAQHRGLVDSATVATVDGVASWPLRIEYPAWGRYLLRVCDDHGGHCTGRVFYVDWPGWAGQPREVPGVGANVLTVGSDRDAYQVGETARIELPEASAGRALVTIENGSRILDARWIDLEEGRAGFEVPVTADMSPTAYVSVTLVQPHHQRGNDRPIRMYGIVPLSVTDPATHLTPVLEAGDEWRPETQVSIGVSERSGRAMTYTLAVVDEGLLGLTNFGTPELHEHFYQKEALGVRTWDVYDHVVGAYGAALERLLALGGDAEGELEEAEPNRFPPVVRFLGPFDLAPGQRAEHRVDLPRYIGAVRVMVVAGRDGAYGSAEKSVFVREPLSLLATLPRVISPEEEFVLPVSLFAMTEDVRDATVRVETDEFFEIVGEPSATVRFDGLGEEIAFLRLRAGRRLGTGQVVVSATSGPHSTGSEVFLTIRSPNPRTVRDQRSEIAPGERWATTVAPHGLPGTNRIVLEATTIPPLDLERRVGYLVRNPHGSAESFASAAFPQLYLPVLVDLDDERRLRIEENVRLAIDRLRGYQVGTGAFNYWPGAWNSAYAQRNAWATSYVGHFLIEAERRGYYVPAEMKAEWISYQRGTAQAWTAGPESSDMDQAYRLYTLALAGRAELGAMNRLRASGELGYVAQWLLAAAYGLAGLQDVAGAIADAASREAPAYERPGWHWGSRLRDRAIRLTALLVLGRDGEADALAREISDDLYSQRWYNTHSVSFALLAMAQKYGVTEDATGFSYQVAEDGADFVRYETAAAIHTRELIDVTPDGEALEVLNTTDRPLFVSVVAEGTPAAGDEVAASSGLEVQVRYTDPSGAPVDVRSLEQGADFVATVTVTNRTTRRVDNLALEHRLPSGWEILNPRLGEGDEPQRRYEHQDIRDDRVLTYFGLAPAGASGSSASFSTMLNAAYRGTYYLPSINVEAMYDASVYGRTAGFRVRVQEVVR